MQLASCMVLLGGDMLNQTPKFGVTPAEVVILKAIHGDSSVVKIEQTGTDRRDHSEEYDRLVQAYGAATGEDRKSIFRTLFPNRHAKLPVSFKEVGVDIMEDEPPAKRVKADPEVSPVKETPAVKAAENFLAGAPVTDA